MDTTYLKTLVQISESLDPWTRFIVFIIASFMLFISYKAYTKTKNKKLFLVTLGFGTFAIKWGLMLFDFYYTPGYFMNSSVTGVFDLFVLAFLFSALLK